MGRSTGDVARQVPLYVDSHCHLDRYQRPMDVLRAAERAGVVTVGVTELPSSFQRLKVMVGRRPRVRLAIGCHPLRAEQVTAAEKALFGRLVDHTGYVGEIGLDGSAHGRATLGAQRRILDSLLDHPAVQSKVLSVHSRGAEEETIERLSAANVTAVLHWYTGALKHIPTALDAGLWFSVNPTMLGSQKGLNTIAALPKERVITETDGPFARTSGRDAMPSDVPQLVVALARIWGEDPEATRERIFESMITLGRGMGGKGPAPSARSSLPGIH